MAQLTANMANSAKKRKTSFVKGEAARIQDIINDGYIFLGHFKDKRHPLNGLTKLEWEEICKQNEIKRFTP